MELNNSITHSNDEYGIYYGGAFVHEDVEYSELDYNAKYSDWYKNNPTDKCWQVDNLSAVGELLFSFDKKKIYNLWMDYPHNFTDEQIEIFKREQPYWANFFSSRLKEKKPKKK